MGVIWRATNPLTLCIAETNMADEGERYGRDKSANDDKTDLVRQEYKRYKRKKPPPDFSEVVDFDNSDSFRGRVEKFEMKNPVQSKFGLRCAEDWRAYKLVSCPGLIFITNPFLDGAQHYWTRRCIRDFPRKPNVCNLDAHMALGNTESLWDMSRNQRYGTQLRFTMYFMWFKVI